nr:hypothetical protein [Candidatus Sigynarchaeota archaeon]
MEAATAIPGRLAPKNSPVVGHPHLRFTIHYSQPANHDRFQYHLRLSCPKIVIHDRLHDAFHAPTRSPRDGSKEL